MNIEFSMLILYVVISALLTMMPYLIFPSIPFGVRIPLANADDPAILAERKKYVLRMIVLSVVLFAVQMVLNSFFSSRTVGAISMVALIVLGWIIYYISHLKLLEIKRQNAWYADKRQVIAANATPRSNSPSRLYWILLALSCLVITATAAICITQYSNLPSTFQYVFPGSLGHWVLSKTTFHALIPVLFQIGLTLLLAGFAWLRNFGRQPVEIEDPEDDRRYQMVNIQIIQILFFALALGLDCAILVTGLSGWGMLHTTVFYTDLFTLVPIVLCLIISPILLLGLRNKRQVPIPETKKVSLDDDRYWRLGVIYFNREDPSLMVNKRFGIGRTFNFGNPIAWIILAALVIFIIIRATR